MLKKRKWLFQITAAIILPLLFLTILRCLSLTSGETCVDPYYHIAVAETGPSLFMGKSFPHMTMSTWENNFSDKELAYHFILSGLRSWHSILGFPPGPPFNFPALFFTGILLCAFVYIAYRFQIRHICLYSSLLACISPSFTHRILMLRPHLLGITLLIIAAYLSSKIKKASDLYMLLILGFLASWSYSNPHFILLPVLAFAFFTFHDDKKLAVAMPMAALAGILAGLLIHPQFPNTFITWKIQCVDVIIEILNNKKNVFPADEFEGIDLIWIKANIIFFVLFLFNIISFSLMLIKNKFKNIPVPIRAFFLMSIISVAGLIPSVRTIEYACPFTVITSGLIVARMKPLSTAYLSFRKTAYALFAVMILTGSIYTSNLYYHAFKDKTLRLPVKFAEWIAKTNIPAGTVIANIRWADFPALYYTLPQYRYLVGLDPMFAYRKNPEAIEKLEAFRTGKIKITPAELAALTNARFAYVSAQGIRLAETMYKSGYKMIYNDDESYFFVLPEPEKQP